jgi:hypothetical protein
LKYGNPESFLLNFLGYLSNETLAQESDTLSLFETRSIRTCQR